MDRMKNHACRDQARSEAAPPSLAGIFFAFFGLGLTAFGGPAMIPHIRDLAVAKKHWVSKESCTLGLSICQAVPGATGMQLCAYLGLLLRGLPGAVAAFTGFALPAYGLITLLSALYFNSLNLAAVAAAFSGLKAVVLALIGMAAFDSIANYSRSGPSRAITALAAAALLAGLNPIAVILGAGALGAAVFAKGAPDCQSRPLKAARARPGAVAATALAALAGLVGLRLLDPALFDLALSMCKVDLFAFGGFGAFPVMLHEVVNVRGWMPESVFLDGIALGQTTPGPILLTSAFVGYHLAGLAGSLVGAVAVFAPSFLLLVLVLPYCDKLLCSRRFRGALQGILATLGGLLIATGAMLAATVAWSPGTTALGLAALAALYRRIPVALVVICGAAFSAVFL
jgi:chromate transporter